MPDLQPYYNYIFAAVAVLVALWLLWFVLKQLNRGGRGRRGNRLGVVEYHEIDQTRRLVLVRRDGVEHLVMIGGAHDLVVESGINPTHPHLQPRPDTTAPLKVEEVVPLRAPRAPVFGAKRPSLQSVPADPVPNDDEPTPA